MNSRPDNLAAADQLPAAVTLFEPNVLRADRACCLELSAKEQ